VALFYMNKVVRADPAFREVSKRVAALGGGPGRPPAEGEVRGAARPVNGVAAGRSPAPRSPSGAAAPAPGVKKNIGYL